MRSLMTPIRQLLTLMLFITTAHAVPYGHGALLYDAQFSNGPDSSQSNNPGQWISSLQQFNSAATPSTEINRLYPYSGDIEMSCTGPSDCVYSGPNQNVFVYFNTPAYGQLSVAAYDGAFPNATILPIIDGATKSSYLIPLNDPNVGIPTADLLASELCADDKVDGVLLDLEPFDIDSPGQFAFYRETSIDFSKPPCVNSTHPSGRYMGVFLNPNKVSSWSKLSAALGNNGYVVVSAYDVNDRTPPTPVSINAYSASITGMLQGMDTQSKTNQIAYTVAIPAASSFSEFTQFGFYNATLPAPYFQLQTDYTPQGITQLGYVQAARAIITANCKSPYFRGIDYWSWNQYISPDPSTNELLMPNSPDSSVVAYLQQYG